MRLRLSQWERVFPDGVSFGDYHKIGLAIRKRGPRAMITIDATADDLARLIQLRNELDRLIFNKKGTP